MNKEKVRENINELLKNIDSPVLRASITCYLDLLEKENKEANKAFSDIYSILVKVQNNTEFEDLPPF